MRRLFLLFISDIGQTIILQKKPKKKTKTTTKNQTPITTFTTLILFSLYSLRSEYLRYHRLCAKTQQPGAR